MFSERSCKPCMKGSFSGGRVLTSSFISDQCLWGALVDLQGAGVSAAAFLPAFLPAFHGVWHILLACQAGQWAGLIHQTLLKGQLCTMRQKEQNIPQKIVHMITFFAFTSFLSCISVWKSDCSISTCKANVAWDVSSGPYVGAFQANREEQKAW